MPQAIGEAMGHTAIGDLAQGHTVSVMMEAA